MSNLLNRVSRALGGGRSSRERREDTAESSAAERTPDMVYENTAPVGRGRERPRGNRQHNAPTFNTQNVPVPPTNQFNYNDGQSLRTLNDNDRTINEEFANRYGYQNVADDSLALAVVVENAGEDEQVEDLEDLATDEVGEEDGEDEDLIGPEDLISLEQRNSTEPSEAYYDNLPQGHTDGSDSIPYSGFVVPDEFDYERDDLRLGMIFRDKRSLKEAVCEWSIKNNRQFVVRPGASNKKCWEVYCALRQSTHCAWKLRGSKQQSCDGYWKIVTLNPTHTCLFTTTHRDHPNLKASLIMKEITHLVSIDPSIRISMLVVEIAKKYKVAVSYTKVWYAKQKTVAAIYGDWAESYEEIEEAEKAQRNKVVISFDLVGRKVLILHLIDLVTCLWGC